MKAAILSPHTDDAIFSLGDYMQRLDDVTIVSVFAGIPTDPEGKKKHTILREEHQKACETLGVSVINGDFLDDVYSPRPTEQQIALWLAGFMHEFDYVLCPIGIHHPDHILLRNTVFSRFPVNGLYKELPYGILYPQLLDKLILEFRIQKRHLIYEDVSTLKRSAILCYKSQIQSPNIMGQLLLAEELYDL